MSDREKFEQWIVENRPDAELYRRDVKGSTRFGEYCKRAVQEQWEVWQASRRADALAAAHFRIAELEAKCRLYEASLDKADKEADGLRAARIAYASEFAPDAEGLPDVGSIHANIRALMKALTEIAEQEHIELMLDPTWAQRVAAAALAQQEPK
jgi:hypothetical protein